MFLNSNPEAGGCFQVLVGRGHFGDLMSCGPHHRCLKMVPNKPQEEDDTRITRSRAKDLEGFPRIFFCYVLLRVVVFVC